MAVEAELEQFSTTLTQGRLHCSQHIVTYTAKQVLSRYVSSLTKMHKHHKGTKGYMLSKYSTAPSLLTYSGLHGKRVNAHMPLRIALSP